MITEPLHINCKLTEASEEYETQFIEVPNVMQATHARLGSWSSNQNSRIENFTVEYDKVQNKHLVKQIGIVLGDNKHVSNYDVSCTGIMPLKYWIFTKKVDTLKTKTQALVQLEVDTDTAQTLFALLGSCNSLGQSNTLKLHEQLRSIVNKINGELYSSGKFAAVNREGKPVNLTIVECE